MRTFANRVLLFGFFALLAGRTSAPAAEPPGAAPPSRPSSDTAPPATQPYYTFVLVHGAWGGGWEWKKVGALLPQQGHAVYRPTLTGQGERVHLAMTEVDLNTHIQDIVNVILFEDLHDGMIPPPGPDKAPPYIVPISAKIFETPAVLKNPAAKKIPATYILCVNPGGELEKAAFHKFYLRAKQRGYFTETIESNHVVNQTHPLQLVPLLERAPVDATRNP